ncbi:sensor histidine kinase [Reyranella sp.]|uniref:sensor histidine kinase n=1 Tax=Reyranella sp. TaxID=1929291 RepID=UPI003BAD6633
MPALPDAETLLNQIVAGLDHPFYALDADWRFILYNDAAATYFGRTVDQVLGRTVWEVFPDEVEHERGHLLRRAMTGRAVVKGEATSMISGRLVAYCLFPLGEGVGVTFRDVSDRRDAQAALLDRTAALEAVLETVPTAVWFTYDPDGSQIVRNRRAAEILRVPAGGGAPLAVVSRRPLRLWRDGTELPSDQLPLRRASRGESVDGELMELVHDNGDRRTLLIRASPLRGRDGAVIGAVCAAADVTERQRYEDQLRLLLDELNHRVKNTLAIVQSIAALTLKDIDPLAREGFEGRLTALADAHNLLTERSWSGASLDDVLRASLRSLLPAEDRVRLAGEPVIVQPRTAVALSLATHELATNALKYGALSSASGRIEIGWTADGGRFCLVWRETGGPPVGRPSRSGFGTRMVRQALAAELRGSVEMDYRPEGLVCTIECPLEAIRDGR